MATEATINQGLVTTSNVMVEDPGAPKNESENSSVQVEFGKITCDMVRPNPAKLGPDGKPNRSTAQLRQETIRLYPSGRIGNNMQDTLFSLEDFGFEIRRESSFRMAFIDVPLGTTREQVQNMIDALYLKAGDNVDLQPVIYQVMSDNPILSDTQHQALRAGLVNLDDIAYGRPDDDPNSETYGVRIGGQLVRYGARADESLGQKPWMAIPGPSGLDQFRQTFFSKTRRPDKDTRTQARSQGTTTFSRKELSERSKTILTEDQLKHEGEYRRAGSNKPAAEVDRLHDFSGTVTRGEQARGAQGMPAYKVATHSAAGTDHHIIQKDADSAHGTDNVPKGEGSEDEGDGNIIS